MSVKKFGPFLQKNSTKVFLNGAPVVKLIDPSIQTIKDVRDAIGPKTLIIVRKFFKSQPLKDPIGEAQNWGNIFLPYMTSGLDRNVVFEGYNEISDADTSVHAVFEEYRQAFLHQYGYGGVYGNHGVGNLDNQSAKPYGSLISKFNDRDFFGWHSYWGTDQTVLNPWHTLRWTLVDMLKDVPALITECGRDFVKDINLSPSLWGTRGWRLGKISEEQYYNEFMSFGAALDSFDNLAGATIFLVGPCETQWDNYQTENLYRRIKENQTGNYFYVSDQPIPPVEIPVENPVDDSADRIKELFDETSKNLTKVQKLVGYVENDLDEMRKIIYGK